MPMIEGLGVIKYKSLLCLASTNVLCILRDFFISVLERERERERERDLEREKKYIYLKKETIAPY